MLTTFKRFRAQDMKVAIHSRIRCNAAEQRRTLYCWASGRELHARLSLSHALEGGAGRVTPLVLPARRIRSTSRSWRLMRCCG